jgi:hypothetical protein
MDILKIILEKLKGMGCCGIKISFEDEGALLNEIISMRYLTSSVDDIGLSIKIGGCEAKRDIIDCINLCCDTIVAPMIESEFALKKFNNSLAVYNYNKKKGFNLETINGYKELDNLKNSFDTMDFVTLGRVDFVSSLGKDRSYVDTPEMYEIATKIFQTSREKNIMCYLGGGVSIASKDFIINLFKSGLLDKFETRYIIYDAHKVNLDDFEKLLYWANIFEVEWLKYISSRYLSYGHKDTKRIKMIEDRISINK